MTTRVSPWFAVVLLTCVLVIPLLAAIRPILDPDLWWHLRAGQWIVEHGQVTETDPFSTWGEGRPWIAYSWLFESLVWGLYSTFGLMGLIILRVVLALAIVLAFWRIVSRSETSFILSTVLTAVAALAVVPLMTERPWLFTILFTTLTLDVLLDLRRGNKRWTYWILPLLYILWANLHIQFVYGLLLLGLGCLAPILDRAFGSPAVHYRSTEWWSLVKLSFVCTLMTLLNPYHVRLLGVVLEYATQHVPFQVVAELSAPDFRTGWDWLALALVLTTAFTLGRRQSLSSFEVLLFLLSTILWLRARRDMWFVVLTALAILPSQINRQTVKAEGGWILALAVGLALVLAFLIVRGRGLSNERLAEAEARLYPAKACAVVLERTFEGPLFNDFDGGGYLIWKLPRCKVSIDGRTNLYGDEKMRRSFDTWAGKKSWEENEDLRNAGLIIAPAQAPLTSLLRMERGRYELIYEDEQAALFVPRR